MRMMKNKLKMILIFTLGLMFIGHALAFNKEDLIKIRNDKEVISQVLKKKEIKRLLHEYSDPEFNNALRVAFDEAILEFLNSESPKKCELKLAELVEKKLIKHNFIVNELLIEDYLKVLRVNQQIDDLLLKMLLSISKDHFELKKLNIKKKAGTFSFRRGKELLANNDLADLFSGLNPMPDEENRCLYEEYVYITKDVRKSKDEFSDKERDLKFLLKKALKKKVISKDAYLASRYLMDESDIHKRKLNINEYFRIIFQAKNKLVPVNHKYRPIRLEDEDRFASERIKRFSDLTRRRTLYQKYDETQIILLAQVLQKASKRMGVDPDTVSSTPVITQEFSTINENGERENYVEEIKLDPQSQYNLARRLLRKDMFELQMMDTFTGIQINYNDMVMAAFETGYISFEDLEFVVKYDDLWNTQLTNFEKIMNLTFRIAGISTVFVPIPWNVTVSLALGIIEGIIDTKTRYGADNDNPSTFIE